MSFLNFCYIDFSNSSVDFGYNEKILLRAKLLGLNESISANKVAYAIFLDRYTPRNEKEARVYFQLKKHEWFAGSLSLQFLKNLLEKFCSSELGSGLKESLSCYIKLLCDAQEHFSQVDYLLAKDIRLNLVVTTGNPIWIKTFSPRILDKKEV